jgi:hypothetical protein
LVRKLWAAATDRGAKAVNAGLVPPLLEDLNAGAGLAVDRGGRAGNEAWALGAEESARPRGAGYDMMNVCL